ncbi:MAG TPA: hypothetical protein VNM24_07905 [Burkholderiales bacterium]|nr:hypothetical protein [Burkholderiales bacterium]
MKTVGGRALPPSEWNGAAGGGPANHHLDIAAVRYFSVLLDRNGLSGRLCMENKELAATAPRPTPSHK